MKNVVERITRLVIAILLCLTLLNGNMTDLYASELVINTEGQVQNLDYYNSRIGILPESVLNCVARHGWTIYLTTTDLTKFYTDSGYATTGHITGLTEASNNRRMWIQDDVDSINVAAIHEIAHTIDYDHGWWCSTNETFVSIADKDRKTLKKYSRVNLSSKAEMFAEMFSMYFTNPTQLYEIDPNAFVYIQTIVCAIEKQYA